MSTSAAESTTEAAVRDYLRYLENPSGLIDDAQVAALSDKLETADDPLDRLRLLTQLEKAQQPDEAAYKQAFIAHAKQWADANDVSASAFEKLGVDPTVLRAAGLTTRRGAHSTRRPSANRTTVKSDAVRDLIRRTSGTFTLADIIEASGASPMTVRKAVYELVEHGDVERLGRDPNWNRHGRAPLLFERRH